MKLIRTGYVEWIKIGDYVSQRQPERYKELIKIDRVTKVKRDVTEEITRYGEVDGELVNIKRLMEEKQGVNMF